MTQGSIGWFLELFGKGMTCIFTLFSIIFIVIGLLLALEFKDGVNFVVMWLVSQAFSYLGTSVIGLVFHVWWNYEAHKVLFEKRFGRFFPATGATSYTRVAAESKRHYGEHPGGFEDWDLWFRINGPAGDWGPAGNYSEVTTKDAV